MTSTLIIVPTYNERENIPLILGRALAAVPDADVLVVDDGSPDGTAEIVQEMIAADPRIHLLQRETKNGLGGAYLAGFRYAADHDYALVVEMDADGSHPPERLPAMLAVFQRPDAATVGGVIGSRWVPGGSVVNWPASRQLISRAGSLYARIALGVPVRDVTAGYRVYPTAVLEELDLGSIESRGYCFQIDMTRRVVASGRRVVEVPIEFRERELGESKMSGGIVVEAMLRVTQWGFQRLGRALTRPFRRA
ncbi:polyprenol monophosphomannose synthase [Microbacterium sp. 67-17]|mgnify:CR=1 FL=1|uniref:polyprenol monophosphomannose synthase n=1 Tax=Microbacterium sp. 67-17 TaxID=1895782 RepID=UPI000ADC7487|nr:polyprenol monophosphomannose synthase [Microbacterium sp. 67-17]